jgi:DNA-binding MarR family transcriptional regulator
MLNTFFEIYLINLLRNRSIMNKTVKLVNLWADFEKKHPDGDINDFCRYHLIHQREIDNRSPLVGGVIPEHAEGLLLKIVGRISRINMVYAYAAFAGTGVDQLEEFGILLAINREKNPKKTEVIYSMLLELSSGTDMLNRLIKRGFIREYPDEEDKRAKRLTLTAEGETALEHSRLQIGKVAKMLLFDMEQDDKELCIRLLKNVEQKFSALFHEHKGKKFDDIYNTLVTKT